jgi:prophage tail gpP-like protein
MADPLIPPQVLDPTKVKAVITTKWSGTAYHSVTIRRVESYSISSQLDSDADPWSLEIGNPDADLNPVLVRDNEVRVQVYGAGEKPVPLLTGVMDDVVYTEQGTLQLSGRDMSAIAVDSDHFPDVYRGMSPTAIIELEAKQINCAKKFQITKIIGGPKKQETDGSEKYWEFWYRMVRKDGMWIWMLADGTLVVSKLHYDYAPVYSFASAKVAKKNDLLVETFSFHKTTQGRFHRLGIAWRQQSTNITNKPTITVLRDPGTNYWTKQPQKLIEDKHATSIKTATKVGQEEIFESKVGALEIVLTVQDPGFLIVPDRVAHVNLPEYNISGNWYVVGSTIRGGQDGFLQDVRLRERHFAISKRVPDDPVWTKDPTQDTMTGEPSGKAAKAIYDQMGPNGSDWFDCFRAAAMKWHSKYDLALFMAYLLAICEHETGFTNERSIQMARSPGGGGQTDAPGESNREWFDIRKQNPTTQEYAKFRTDFSNESGDGVIPSGYACAVGPMQLFDQSAKNEADALGGSSGDLFGSRWNPCSNIMVAAHLLRDKSPTQNGSEADLLRGICGYAGERLDSNNMCGMAYYCKSHVHNDPGWLQLVQDALSSIEPPGDSGAGDGPGPGGGCNLQAAGWANKVLDYMAKGKINISWESDREDIRRTAQGLKTKRYGICIDSRVMSTMIAIADKWGSMRTYAISSSHSDDSDGWGGHARGYAFDLNGAGGIAFDGAWTLSAHNRDIEVAKWLRSYGAPDVRIICTNVGNAPSCDPEITSLCLPPFSRWDVTCESHANHIHICYTPGVPTQ